MMLVYIGIVCMYVIPAGFQVVVIAFVVVGALVPFINFNGCHQMNNG